jgi:hypothetical protein
METNYEWTIAAINCKPKKGELENVVNVIHWRLKAFNENYYVETYGATSVPNPSETDFTLYENLTKEQVVSWVVDILSIVTEYEKKSELEKIKENLNSELYLKANPIEVNLPLPFNN